MADLDNNLDIPTKLSCWERVKRFFKFHWRGLIIVFTPLIVSPILILNFYDKASRCGYLLVVMAVFWVTEVIPLGITAMFPVVYFPVMGILESDATCRLYLKDTMFMFLGGLMLAVAIEVSNLHKRLALRTMKTVGCSPRRLHFGMSLVIGFISMWISNAATTAMMCPIIKAVLEELEEQGVTKAVDETKKVLDDEPPYPSRTSIAFYLAVCYSATIGGSATLIGTSTSLSFKGIYDARFPESEEILDFPRFMMYCVPGMLLILLGTWLWLEWLYLGLFRPNSESAKSIQVGEDGLAVAKRVIDDRFIELGPITTNEISILIVFIVLIAIYFTRSPGIFAGWSPFFELPVKASAPTILAVILLFLLPLNYAFFRFCCNRPPFPTRYIPSLVTWPLIHQKVPWELLFLMGAGFALAEGSNKSGLNVIISEALAPLETLPRIALLFFVIITSEVMTSVSSNTAIANILLPICAEMALVIRIHPLYLMFPSAWACSMAFHLPVSTPPNAIVAKFANIRSKDMVVAGIGPTIISIIVVWTMSQTYGLLIYPNVLEFPTWNTLKANTTDL